MNYIRHQIPEIRVFDGEGCFEALSAELQRLGCQRAVIVCGRSLGNNPQMLAPIRQHLGERLAGICTDVQPHSPLAAVQAVAQYLRSTRADGVVAVGGGSAIVTARAASILYAEEQQDISKLCTQQMPDGSLYSPRLLAKKIPQIIVPTTPTTAISKAGSAVLDKADGSRRALFDPKTRARSVFIHPGFVASAPWALVQSAAFNALALAVEGLLSKAENPMSDAALMHAIGGIYHVLKASAGMASETSRRELIYFAILAGQGTDHTGAGMCIPMGHAISSMFSVDNGIANAIMMPHVLRFNAGAAQHGIEKLALALRAGSRDTSIALVSAVAEKLHGLAAAIQYPLRLRDVGIGLDRLPDIAAVAIQDWYIKNNPIRIDDSDQIGGVLRAAW